MAQREGTSAVYSGVLRETLAGPVAGWVTPMESVESGT